MKKRFVFCFFITALLYLALPAKAGAGLPIVPKPLSEKITGNNISFSNNLKVFISPNSKLNEAYLRSIFNEIGLQTVIVKSKREAQLSFKIGSCFSENREAYTLIVDKKGRIDAVANSRTGLIYAAQSLRQIIKNDNGKFVVPCCVINDKPAFEWRAYMQDESRHFQGMETVKKLLNEMARIKLNTLHWHLVDDQGWRIEIKKYPLLTSIGSKRDNSNWGITPADWDKKYPGKKTYYTQKEIKEIVQYARDRGIKVVPEFEIPGHSSAAIDSYPWLSSAYNKDGKQNKSNIYNITNPKVETFIHDVLNEIIALFPSKIIHIGGDEVDYSQWQNNPDIMKFMADNNIPTCPDLQIWSINRISKYITSKGCRMMGWNEITGDNIRNEANRESGQTEKLTPGTIVHFWDGALSLVNKAVEKGYDVVNSNRLYTYLDYGYETTSLSKAYSFNPIPEGLPQQDEKKILGFGCQMWGEGTPTAERVYFQVFPRIAALAECGWTKNDQKDLNDFMSRFTTSLEPWWKANGFINTQKY